MVNVQGPGCLHVVRLSIYPPLSAVPDFRGSAIYVSEEHMAFVNLSKYCVRMYIVRGVHNGSNSIHIPS